MRMRGKSLNPNPLPTPLAMIPNPPATVEGWQFTRARDFAPPHERVSDRRHDEEGKVAAEMALDEIHRPILSPSRPALPTAEETVRGGNSALWKPRPQ